MTSPAEPGRAQRDGGRRDFTLCTRRARCPLRPLAVGAHGGGALGALTPPALPLPARGSGQGSPDTAAVPGGGAQAWGWPPPPIPAPLRPIPVPSGGRWATGAPQDHPASLRARPAPGSGHCLAAPRLRRGIRHLLRGGVRSCGGKTGLKEGQGGCTEGSWLGLGTRGGTRGARSPRHLAQQGLSLLAGLAQAAGGHSWRWQCVSPDCGAGTGLRRGGPTVPAPGPSPARPRSAQAGTGAPLCPRCRPRAGTLTTHQHRMHFISPKGGTEGCQLSLLRYQRRPKRQARGPSACMLSASSGMLFSGAAGEGTGGGTGTATRWWHRGRGRGGPHVPGHCLQQSEGLARTGLAQVRRGHCTFSQCTSPVVPCGERAGLTGAPAPGAAPALLRAPPHPSSSQHSWVPGWLCRVGARAHLAGANGTLDEAEGGHDGVPAGAGASPRLVPIEVAACGR